MTDAANGLKKRSGTPSAWKVLRFGDLLVVVAVVALAVGLWGVPGLVSSSVATGAVLVHDGTTVRSFTSADLQKDAAYDVESEGYHFTILTGSGRIRFGEADCPDKVCVQTGWISRPPQVAACVPGHLLLRVLGDSGDVDVITG
jgi:hypothetical protein